MPVEKEKIIQIIEAGMQAPSAGNQQPWEFSLNVFNGLVDHITVYAKDDIRFTFRNRQEIRA